MNKYIVTAPRNLADKLLQIRNFLRLSQTEVLERLGFEQCLYQSNISQYERGEREPPLLVLFNYAKVAGLPAEILIDDKAELSL